MMYSDNELSIMMLCMKRRPSESLDVKPLDAVEWSVFMQKLIDYKKTPAIILSSFQEDISEMGYGTEFLERLKVLSKRGVSIAMELDDNSRKGIATLTCTSADYPILLRREMGRYAPAVIQYAGEIELAKKMGIIFVSDKGSCSRFLGYAETVMGNLNEKLVNVYADGNIKPVSSASIGYYTKLLNEVIKNRDIFKQVIAGKSLVINADIENADENYIIKCAWSTAYKKILCGNEKAFIQDNNISVDGIENVFFQSKLPVEGYEVAKVIL